MQMRVIAIPPARELTDLTLVATHGLSTARATALREEAFDQQRVASNADHSLLGSVAEQVDLFSVIESLDVHLPHTGNLKDPATKTA